MVKRLLFVVAVALALSAAFLYAGQGDEAAAVCTHNECVDCIALNCEWSPTGGHCNCETGVAQGGGRYCVAGGGICIPKE